MNRFDVSVYAIRRRAGRRRPFEVRWRAADRSKSKSFITRKLADSYRAELVRAARMGLDFDPLTGEPMAWDLPEPAIVTWYEEATAYTVMKWPSLAAHSRASLAEALATVTPVLIRPGVRDRPDKRELRTALYQHAFNPARPADPGSPAAQILDWAQQASLPVGCLSEPAVLRIVLEALTFRLDGSRAAANTIIRKRVVLHGALGYAAETGLLPDNPLDSIAWHVPQSSAALDPAVVASPDQVSALLDAVARTRPELAAFFGCLYYAALRPEEAVALRLADCHLPGSGRGVLRLAAATPRTAAAWTSDGTSHEQRGLKHRPDGSIRMVPAPPVLVAMLRAHHAAYGTAPDGRLFRGTYGGPLSGSVYGRTWQSARTLALGPELAAVGLARRPYDLRHAALSLWLNAGGDPAQIAARAGNSVAVLLTVYSHCIHGHDDLLNQQISRVLRPPPTPGPCPSVESQRLHPTAQFHGSQRLHRPRDGHPSRPLCVRGFPAPPTDGPQTRVGTKRAYPETISLTIVISPAQSKD
ncbi:MAG: site-specific integrase [Streptosporangiaceae bacterium]